jgi:hypothetical protein
MKPVENLSRAWRLFTVQLSAGAIVLGSIPAETQAVMLDAVGVPSSRVPAILGALMLVARLVSQPKAK